MANTIGYLAEKKQLFERGKLMICLTNLKIWDNKIKDFVEQDIEVHAAENTQMLEGTKINCQNFLAIPLGVDLHVHFREPGYTHKEDLYTGSLAALYGGITTVLDMPNTLPITDSVETILQKKELAAKKALVDVKVAAAITDNNTEKVVELARHCDAFKVFMAESFGNLAVKYENIEKALKLLNGNEIPVPIIFHAEDKAIIEEHSNKATHLEHHPPEAEAEAIQKIIGWAADYPNLHFHVTHISSSLSVKLLQFTSLRNLTSDTCLRYLLLDQDSSIPEEYKKVNPPLRTSYDRKNLLDAFGMGIIDMISSDHSPHTKEEKINQKLSGMPGVQELLPGLLSLIQHHQIEWERAIEAYHTFPTKLLNITNNQIEKRNFLIIDTTNHQKVTKKWIKTKVGWSPYEDWIFNGKIIYLVQNNKLRKLD